MSVLKQIKALKQKHTELEMELEEESSRLVPNFGAIGNLKGKISNKR